MSSKEFVSPSIIEDYLIKKGLPTDFALTFPDVFIIDRKSRLDSRSETKLETVLARNIKLNIPVISANMADITESRMAITLARSGGCGFIHQFASLDFRIEEVKKVKRADNEIIENPWTIKESESLDGALKFMKEKEAQGVLVINEEGGLVGILTERDIRFYKFFREIFGEPKYSSLLVRDVMTRDLVTAKEGIETLEAIKLLQSKKIEKLPIIDKEGRPIGLITAKDILKKTQFPEATRDLKGRLIVGATVGVSKSVVLEVKALKDAGADVILIDTARANSYIAERVVKKVRNNFPDIPIIAGNVDNSEGAYVLIQAGADAIKVGIGPGSMCKTREETGIGAPQLTAIAECAAVCKNFGVRLIADGGISQGNHIAKAIVAGADVVMLGGVFAGTEETPGEVYYDGNKQFKRYRGSASLDIQLARIDMGDLDRIRAPEGERKEAPYTGKKATSVLKQLMGDLMSSMSYANAKTISEFQEAKFMRQSHAGYMEGKPQI